MQVLTTRDSSTIMMRRTSKRVKDTLDKGVSIDLIFELLDLIIKRFDDQTESGNPVNRCESGK